MKIKRFNNLWLMGLILSASILGIIYFLKICFPSFVIEVAQIDSITRIGHYIDTHKWAWYVASTVLSIFSYYLICSGCCKKKSLNMKEIIYIISTILLLYIIKEFAFDLYTAANIISMILLPFLMGAEFKPSIISFISLNLLQIITLSVRNLDEMIIDFNFATLLILMIDYYIMEVLLYFYFNYKEN